MAKTKRNLSLGKLAYSVGLNADTASQTSLDDCGDNRSLVSLSTKISDFWAEFSGSVTDPDTITLENLDPHETVYARFNPTTSGSLSYKTLSSQTYNWDVSSNLDGYVESTNHDNVQYEGFRIQWEAVRDNVDINGWGTASFQDYFITDTQTDINTEILFRVSSL